MRESQNSIAPRETKSPPCHFTITLQLLAAHEFKTRVDRLNIKVERVFLL